MATFSNNGLAAIQGLAAERPASAQAFSTGDEWHETDTGNSYIVVPDGLLSLKRWLFLAGTGPGSVEARLEALEREFTLTTLTIYMSPTGSDANDGATPLTPVQTLARALDLVPAAARDRILIDAAPGTYPDISTPPPGGDVRIYEFGKPTYGTPSASPGSTIPQTAQPELTVVGNFAVVATFTLTAVAGNMLSTGVPAAADQYLGAYVRVTSGPAAGLQREIFESTAPGVLRTRGNFPGLAPGATIEVVRPSAVFPWAAGVIFDGTNGGKVSWVACKFDRTGVGAGDFEVQNMGMVFAVCEIDLGAQTGAGALTANNADVVLGTTAQRFPKFTAGGVQVTMNPSGTYIHKDPIPAGSPPPKPATGFRVRNTSLSFPELLGMNSSVAENIVIFNQFSMIGLENCEIVRSIVTVREGSLSASGGINRDAAPNGPDQFGFVSNEMGAINILDGSVGLITSEMRNFASNGIVVDGGSRAILPFAQGAGDETSAYGVVVSRSSVILVDNFAGLSGFIGELLIGGAATAWSAVLTSILIGGVFYYSKSVVDYDVRHVNLGPSEPLEVSVGGTLITVSLATDGAGVVTSTNQQVAQAVSVHPWAGAVAHAEAIAPGLAVVGGPTTIPDAFVADAGLNAAHQI